MVAGADRLRRAEARVDDDPVHGPVIGEDPEDRVVVGDVELGHRHAERGMLGENLGA